jgi:hypothetical protein
MRETLAKEPLLEDDSHPCARSRSLADRAVSPATGSRKNREAQTEIPDWIEFAASPARCVERVRNEARAVETEIKFAGYLDQQKKSIEKLKAAESVTIPDWIEYSAISGLSREMRETLERVPPHHHRPGQPHSRRHPGRALAGACSRFARSRRAANQHPQRLASRAPAALVIAGGGRDLRRLS